MMQHAARKTLSGGLRDHSPHSKEQNGVALVVVLLFLVAITGISVWTCLLYTSPSPRDRQKSRMPSSA